MAGISKSACLAIAILAATSSQSFSQQVQNAGTPEIKVRAETARQLMEVTNLRLSAEKWRDMLLQPAAFPTCQCGSSEEQRALMAASWTKAVSQAFNVDDFAAEVENAVAHQLGIDDMKAALHFHTETELGRKVTSTEKAFLQSTESASEQKAKLRDAQAMLVSDPKRADLVDAIVSEVNAVDFTTNALVNLSLGTAIGTMAALPKGYPRMDESQLMAMIDGQRTAIRAIVASTTVPSYAVLYEPLSNSDLQGYLAALRTPHNKRTLQTVLAAFDAAIRRQAVAIGAAFGRIVTASRA